MVVNGKIVKAELKFDTERNQDPVFLLRLTLVLGSSDGPSGPCGQCGFEVVLDEEVFFNGKYVCRKATEESGAIIRRVLQIAGANDWSEVEGKYVRCVFDGNTIFSRLIGIEHIIDGLDIWLEK